MTIFLEVIRDPQGSIINLRQAINVRRGHKPKTWYQTVAGNTVAEWASVDLCDPIIEIDVPETNNDVQTHTPSKHGLTQANIEAAIRALNLLGATKLEFTKEDGAVAYFKPTELSQYNKAGHNSHRITLGNTSSESLARKSPNQMQLKSTTDLPKEPLDFSNTRDVHNMIARYLEIAKSDNPDVAEEAMAMAQTLMASIGLKSK